MESGPNALASIESSGMIVVSLPATFLQAEPLKMIGGIFGLFFWWLRSSRLEIRLGNRFRKK